MHGGHFIVILATPDAIQHIHKPTKRVCAMRVPILTWFKARACSYPSGILRDGKLKDASLSHCQVALEEAVFLAGMEVQTSKHLLLNKHRQ